MRRDDRARAAALLVVAACGGAGAGAGVATPPAPEARVRALRAPPAADRRLPGAAYLAAIAARVQPAWAQFVADCRLRLPASHPLNRFELAVTIDLAIEPSGGVSGLDVETSGDADFDRAARDAVIDSSPLPAPPPELVSDDDLVHVRWLFARDDRQAGAATASVDHVTLPLAGVIDHELAHGELARAANRIAAAPAGDPAVEPAVTRLMIAVLREALGSADGTVVRAAIDAIARAHATELAADVRARLADVNDTELRVVAIAAAGALGDVAAVPELARELAVDLPAHPRLATAEARSLVALGHAADVASTVRAALDGASRGGPAVAAALGLLAIAPAPDLAPRVRAYLAHGDVQTRAAACAALAGGAPAWSTIERGLDDGDGIVRAACADAAAAHARDAARGTARESVVYRLHQLVADRDHAARACAIAALVALDPEHAPRAAADPAPQVRAAYAVALAAAPPAFATARDDLAALAGDGDPDVRAAAVVALAARDELAAPDAARAAASDASPVVRVAAIPRVAASDADLLARLAGDADPGLASAATIRLATVRGRAASTRALLDRIAAAPAGSAERVRAAVAWLLAG
nr:TonB C-terminal domain-containing protein [Kofleriaceae bacterium]